MQNQFPTHCARCPADLRLTSSIMSKFNTDHICPACKDREKTHPDYLAADAAELAAVLNGQLGFLGLGCPPDLYLPQTCVHKSGNQSDRDEHIHATN